jgi:antiviral helicase SKI2
MHYDFIAKTEKLANDINKSDVTIKGTMAAQINDCNCLLLTEVITQQLLCDLTPIEIVQVLSIFIDDTKTNNDALLSDIDCSLLVKNTIQKIQKTANGYLQKENELRVYYEGADTFWNIKFNYMTSSYMWANGDSLQKILNVTDVYEGNFVKNMLKLNKIVTDIANLCVLNNDITILPTLEKIEPLIMRDVVNVDSLYL